MAPSATSLIQAFVKKYGPASLHRWLGKAGLYTRFRPAPGQLQRGDLDRLWPLSSQFGYDRGGPLDRYYIENFLRQHAPAIQGRVLEIGDNTYTREFGQRVTQSDVLHVHGDNPLATFVGDLSDAPHLPDSSFDCIILTQTLHLIYHVSGALQTCWRILKPGGVLLLTSPGISQLDEGEWNEHWLWSFTATSIRRLLGEVFPPEQVEITTHGNVLVATAFLYGMGQPEVTKQQLDLVDPQYPVIITARATKPYPRAL